MPIPADRKKRHRPLLKYLGWRPVVDRAGGWAFSYVQSFHPCPPFPPFYELIKFLAIDSKQFKHSVFISKPSARLYSQTMNQLALRKFRLGNIHVSDRNIVANSHTFLKKHFMSSATLKYLGQNNHWTLNNKFKVISKENRPFFRQV